MTQQPLALREPPPAPVRLEPGDYVCAKHDDRWAVALVWRDGHYVAMCAACEGKR